MNLQHRKQGLDTYHTVPVPKKMWSVPFGRSPTSLSWTVALLHCDLLVALCQLSINGRGVNSNAQPQLLFWCSGPCGGCIPRSQRSTPSDTCEHTPQTVGPVLDVVILDEPVSPPTHVLEVLVQSLCTNMDTSTSKSPRNSEICGCGTTVSFPEASRVDA